MSPAGMQDSGALFPSASIGVSGPVASGDQTNTTGDTIQTRGHYLDVVVDTTAGAGNVVIAIDGKDPVSGKYYNLLTSTALSGVSTTVLRIGPALTAAANLTANLCLPSIWRVTYTVAGAALTFSVGFSVR